MTNPLQRFPMERAEIDRLVAAFYARVRRHEVLGPIFIRAIGPEGDPHWPEHEAKIASFWRNAILMDREYQGRPMQAHLMNGEVRPEHFALWLDLFEATAHDVLPDDKATPISALARKIGKGLKWGLESATQPQGGIPKLV